MKQVYRLCLCILVVLGVASGVTSAQEEWMPDPNLRQAVRETLGLPDNVLLTQLKIKQLTELNAEDRQIANLTGLEQAINLTSLHLGVNKIRGLSPLQGLVHLEDLWIYGNPLSDLSPLANLVNLKTLDLGGCQISDIHPLANLRGLESLRLHHNHIEDITPLTNLTSLTELWLIDNQIIDVSPLENLTMLEELRLQNNRIIDYSPLDALTVVHLGYDEICDISSFPVSDRINGKKFPAVFAAWGGIGWSPVLNIPELSDLEHIALHDLYFSSLMFTGELVETNSGIKVVGNLEEAQQEREAFLTLNPNMVFLAELRMRDAFSNKYYHEDYPYWLRNEVGDRVEGWPGAFLLDFTHPGQQDIICNRHSQLHNVDYMMVFS